MKTRWSMAFWVLLLAVGCGGRDGGGGSTPSTSGAPSVASYRDGGITLEELEAALPEGRTPACRAARRARGGGTLDELMPCYRELAESLALERLLVAEVDELQKELEGLQSFPQLRRHAYLETFNRLTMREIEVSDQEIEEHFGLHREQYRRPRQATVYNIFRRHADPERREDTLQLLRELKARYEAGETFAELARDYSHSETRSRGGLVGSVTDDKLPERLARVAFSLGEGQISEPVLVRGGAVLLMVRNPIQGVEFALDDVRERIRRALQATKLREEIEERASQVAIPADAVVLEPEGLLAALDSGDAERLVLDLAADRMTVEQARRLTGLSDEEAAADLSDEQCEQFLETYRQRRDNGLLALDLLASADGELREQAEEDLRRHATTEWVDSWLRERMAELVEDDPEGLRRYFEDNAAHYQSPLSFKLRLWLLPFGANPPAQLLRMETLHSRLVAGELDLGQAVAELGGSVRDLGWREYGSLPELPLKARELVLQAERGSFTVPFQQDDTLHVVWVEDRREPSSKTYEESLEEVRADYLTRFEEQLYRRVADEKLAEAGFVFDEEAIRTALAPESFSASQP